MSDIAALIALYNERRFPEMESMAEQVLVRAPGSASLWNLLGVARHAQGKDALDAFRQAVACAPNDADLQQNLAAAHFSRHAYAEAYDAYSTAYRIRPAAVQYAFGCASSLHRLGRFTEALAWYEKVVDIDPGNPDAWSEFGQTYFALNQFERAAACFSRLVNLRDSHPDGFILLGNAMRKLGKPAEAADCYRKALDLRPGNAATCCSLGNVFNALGYPVEAEKSFRAALAIDPSHAVAANDLGSLYVRLGRFQEALTQYELTNELLPGNMDVLYNLGDALRRLERADQAVIVLEQVIAAMPGHYLALNSLGACYTNMNRYDRAMQCFDSCVRLRPDYAPAYGNNALALIGLGRFEEAFDTCSRAIELDSKESSNFSNRSNALFRLGRFEAALADAESALKIAPRNLEALMNFAEALYYLGRKAEAMKIIETALLIAPDDKRTQFLSARFFLLQGACEQGFALYEARTHVSPYKYLWGSVEGCRWTGKEDLEGKSLLLYLEQGLGDAIQMLRFLPQVAEMTARVVLRVNKGVLSLLESVPANVTVIIEGETDQSSLKTDYICSLMSLPNALRVTLEKIPEPQGCISIPIGKRMHWRGRVGKASGMRIGIAWSGNPHFPMDHWRSMPLAQFVKMFDGVGDVEIFALQKDVRREDAPVLRATQIRHFGEEMQDLSDTAALIESMDLIISVDTVIAHLAAALGKEVWLLIPFVGDWRWLSDTDRSPWYPTLKIFRQSAPNQWQDVLENVAALLREQKGAWQTIRPLPLSVE